MVPTPALLLLIATLIPLLGFALLLFIGKRMGNPLSGYVGTALIAASWICSLIALVAWVNNGQHAGMTWGPGDKPIAVNIPWLPTGAGVGQEHPGYLDIGLYVDSLTVAMFNMITLVAMLVHLFSIGYMSDDPRYPRYFTYLSLFCFSMLGLVIGSTLLQIFIFWELVGLCSYLLIGFWYEQRAASNAAIKAFVANRIGDVGFLIGFGILFYHLGNVTLLEMAKWLGSAGLVDGVHYSSIPLPNGMTMSAAMLTLMGIGLFCGAIGKSAQFPLQVWLPDAMEGPTPVSALIHAATMVAAGVYLLARIFPILTPDAKLFIAIIGVVTMTMGALIAITQSDIKSVLAYSTVSQLGLMIMAIGIGSWVGGLFHLITHAFFKALLFLGCGSVIRAAAHEREMPEFGGLIWKTPVTAITFAIGVLSISGTPFFSGYYSKEMILVHAGAFASFAARNHHSSLYWLFFILPVVVAYLTAFYMTRCWMLTFWGKPRNAQLYENARESAVMWFPLVVLATLSVAGGSQLLDIKRIVAQSAVETERYCRELRPVDARAFTAFEQTWPVEIESRAGEPDGGMQARLIGDGEKLVHSYGLWAFAVGIGAAILMYLRGYALADRLMRIKPLRWIHVWLYHGMFFDELYFSVFISVTIAISRAAGAFDKYVVDGIVNLTTYSVRQTALLVGWTDDHLVDGIVNGTAILAQDLGAAVRAPQTGRIRLYVTILVGAVAVGLAVAMIALLSR